jgi:hypothetical protein
VYYSIEGKKLTNIFMFLTYSPLLRFSDLGIEFDAE